MRRFFLSILSMVGYVTTDYLKRFKMMIVALCQLFITFCASRIDGFLVCNCWPIPYVPLFSLSPLFISTFFHCCYSIWNYFFRLFFLVEVLFVSCALFIWWIFRSSRCYYLRLYWSVPFETINIACTVLYSTIKISNFQNGNHPWYMDDIQNARSTQSYSFSWWMVEIYESCLSARQTLFSMPLNSNTLEFMWWN